MPAQPFRNDRSSMTATPSAAAASCSGHTSYRRCASRASFSIDIDSGPLRNCMILFFHWPLPLFLLFKRPASLYHKLIRTLGPKRRTRRKYASERHSALKGCKFGIPTSCCFFNLAAKLSVKTETGWKHIPPSPNNLPSLRNFRRCSRTFFSILYFLCRETRLLCRSNDIT